MCLVILKLTAALVVIIINIINYCYIVAAAIMNAKYRVKIYLHTIIRTYVR